MCRKGLSFEAHNPFKVLNPVTYQ